MPDLALDLRYLKCALVVAEQGSFRRAANVLDLSQSTVSRRIHLLERRLGASLFERSRGGARLTHAGERFIRQATVGAEFLLRAADDLALSKRGDVGELRIGLMASLANGFLADLFYCFRNRTPNVEVKLEEASSQSHVAGVLQGRLDAAFISGSPQLPGCSVRRLWDERVLVALPTGHPLAEQRNVTWDEVRQPVQSEFVGGCLAARVSLWLHPVLPCGHISGVSNPSLA
jgi:DNA-binding transcriptional LysR family regulator